MERKESLVEFLRQGAEVRDVAGSPVDVSGLRVQPVIQEEGDNLIVDSVDLTVAAIVGGSHEILGSVVRSIPIDMVDGFVASEANPTALLIDEPVLPHVAGSIREMMSGKTDENVSVTVNETSRDTRVASPASCSALPAKVVSLNISGWVADVLVVFRSRLFHNASFSPATTLAKSRGDNPAIGGSSLQLFATRSNLLDAETGSHTLVVGPDVARWPVLVARTRRNRLIASALAEELGNGQRVHSASIPDRPRR